MSENVTHKFVRHHGGTTAFAQVTVSTQDGTPWKIDWSDEAQPVRRAFGVEAEAGIEQAAAALRALGGAPTAIRIDAIVYVAVDTKPDAVACAAAIAAWRAWHCDEASAVVERDSNGKWIVTFVVR